MSLTDKQQMVLVAVSRWMRLPTGTVPSLNLRGGGRVLPGNTGGFNGMLPDHLHHHKGTLKLPMWNRIDGNRWQVYNPAIVFRALKDEGLLKDSHVIWNGQPYYTLTEKGVLLAYKIEMSLVREGFPPWHD